MAFVMEWGTGWEIGHSIQRSGWNENTRSVSTGAGAHTGVYGLQCGYLSSTWPMAIIPGAEKYVSIWIKWTAGQGYITFRDAAKTALVRFAKRDDYLDVYVGGVLVEQGLVAFDGGWHHLQLHFSIAEAGVVETIVDGIPDISYAGDTRSGATNVATSVILGNNYTGGGGFFDDFCYGTGGWPGDIRFDPLYVTEDVEGECGFTPSEGTDHYALVDEVPPASADYNYTLVDASDRYGTPGTWDDTDGLGNVVKDPLAVILWADARKQDGNTNDKLRLTQGDGVNEMTGEYESLLTSYENRWLLRDKAPDGGEWTTAKVRALILGVDAQMEV